MGGKKSYGKIEIPREFEEAVPVSKTRARAYTLEQDAAILLHMERIGLRQFVLIFKKNYGWGSRDSIACRLKYLQHKKATINNLEKLHEDPMFPYTSRDF